MKGVNLTTLNGCEELAAWEAGNKVTLADILGKLQSHVYRKMKTRVM